MAVQLALATVVGMASGQPAAAAAVPTMAAAVAGAGLAATPQDGDPMDRYNVIWDSPSKDSTGSMPLGNGDIGLNVWVEPSGDLLFYISKTDAWSGIGRLLKLGRVRVSLTPNPFVEGRPFFQTLRLREGAIEVRAIRGDDTVRLRVWVDANRPVIHVEAEGGQPFSLRASLEVWRTAPRQLKGREMFSAYGLDGAPYPAVVAPDVVMPARDREVRWYHRNEHSIWADTLRWQGMGAWIAEGHDPLLHRTFGGAMKGPGLVAVSDTMLHSERPARRQVLSIYCLTAQTATPEEWAAELDRVVAESDRVSLADAWAAHLRWWDAFWRRSWVLVSGKASGPRMTENDLPLRIGAASDGGSQFHGYIARARLWGRALSPDEIGALAGEGAQSGAHAATPTADRAGLLGDWDLGRLADGRVANAAGDFLGAKASGTVGVGEHDGLRAAHFTGHGWLEVAPDQRLQLTRAVTMDAWIAPDALGPAGGRIIDKSEAGTSNGYMIDTYPGNSLRMIIDPRTLTYGARLEPGRWVHVAATYDADTGEQRLYLNGKAVASANLGGSLRDVTQGYLLQRFVEACAGRGAYPIKFNGSIFTMDATEGDQHFDADYRRWGGPYWFQNTRLPYWPMLAAGDYDMMLPLFRMYLADLPFAKARTEAYFGHAGAFFPETMYFWGAYATENYGWDRAGKPISHVDNTYIRWYWSGGLELSAMMLDYYAHTEDAGFARETLLPLAEAVVDFYDKHYPRDAAGKLVFEPAQSLETWQKAVDPLPVIAGLKFVLGELLALPEGLADDGHREQWRRMLGELPPVPTEEVDGERVLAPAAKVLQGRSNVENPELYAIYPYRLYGVGKPDLAMARRTFELRHFKGHQGWEQDDTQAAFLGLAGDASRLVAARFAMHNPGCRFPAFWGPNFDWVPDQDHGSNGVMALETMLVQSDGRKIYVFPAWPKGWDVDFKLHAPMRTTIEGVYRDGKVEKLAVTPKARRKDVVVMEPQ